MTPEVAVAIEVMDGETGTLALVHVDEAIPFAETMDDDELMVATGKLVERLVHDASHRIAQQILLARERLAAEVGDGD